MTSTDLTIYKPPALLTEREVRLAGATSNRLCTLRGMLRQGVVSAMLSVNTKNGTAPVALVCMDAEALIDLLIERDEMFLSSLNIELERP